MAGDQSNQEDSAFIETENGQLGLRTSTHTYGMRIDAKTGLILNNEECFYDLRSDPYQLTNLSGSKSNQELSASLRERLIAWHNDTPWMHHGVSY